MDSILNDPFKKKQKQKQKAKPKQNPQVQKDTVCCETKHAFCFLCLFGGNKIPSIRRLTRKPRSVCDRSLYTFFPQVFPPSSLNLLHKLYLDAIKCQITIRVDPTSDVVYELIGNYSKNNKSRLIFHYFGQGSPAPTEDEIYLSAGETPQSLRVSKMLFEYKSPLCVIMDCANASVGLKQFQVNKDIFCFFACSQNEQLPISTDAPMDIFSRCLLAPFETSIWWHLRRESLAFSTTQSSSNIVENSFLKSFFFALLKAILYASQSKEVFELYSNDPAMLKLAEGFLLAQRILQSFNIHPVCYPALSPTYSHELWAFWDIAVDISMSTISSDAQSTVFELFLESFRNFPSSSVLPLFSFFLTVPVFQKEAAATLKKYLGSANDPSSEASKCSILKSLSDSLSKVEINAS